jgi:recombination protein RecR
MTPKEISNLVDLLKQIPSIGSYNAERIAFFIALAGDKYKKKLEKSISDLTNLKKCSKCNILSSSDICPICSNPNRDHNSIMIVADSKDAYQIETTKVFFGVYHVLENKIDYNRGCSEKDLVLENLFSRLTETTEIILALDGTLEGEITSKYLKSIIPKNIVLKKIASGMPVGTEMKYTDKQTLINAILNCKLF